MKVSTLLAQIEYEQIVLPQCQSSYVWKHEWGRGLVHSLYKRYPAGSLLAWVTDRPQAMCGRLIA